MYQGISVREQAEFLKKQHRPKGSWPVFKVPKEKKKETWNPISIKTSKVSKKVKHSQINKSWKDLSI